MAHLLALFEYFQAILPLTLAHLAVPPISSFQLTPQTNVDIPPPEIALFVYLMRLISPEILKDPDFIVYLIQEKLDLKTFLNTPEKAFNHRSITHLFVHFNYQHLVSNLMSLFNVGQPLYQEHGIYFFYSVFFFGGISASLPLLEMIMQGPDSKALSIPTKNLGIDINTTDLADLVRHGMKRAILTVSSAFKIETKYFSCGSSGAVCALLGGSTIVTIKQLMSSTKKIYKIYKEDRGRGDSTRQTELNIEIFKCIRYFITCSYAIDFFRSQLVSHYRQQQALSDRSPLFPWAQLFSGTKADFIDYQAHLQGFAFGAITTLAAYGWQYYKKARDPASYWENRSGRRLRD
eukprot:gene10093-10971_t